MQAETLDAAILDALRPDGVLAALRLRLSGGYTVMQVMERLAPEVRRAMGGEEGDVVADRRAVDTVRTALLALEQRGGVRRTRATLGAPLGNKGPRKVVVDLFHRV